MNYTEILTQIKNLSGLIYNYLQNPIDERLILIYNALGRLDNSVKDVNSSIGSLGTTFELALTTQTIAIDASLATALATLGEVIVTDASANALAIIAAITATTTAVTTGFVDLSSKINISNDLLRQILDKTTSVDLEIVALKRRVTILELNAPIGYLLTSENYILVNSTQVLDLRIQDTTVDPVKYNTIYNSNLGRISFYPAPDLAVAGGHLTDSLVSCGYLQYNIVGSSIRPCFIAHQR